MTRHGCNGLAFLREPLIDFSSTFRISRGVLLLDRCARRDPGDLLRDSVIAISKTSDDTRTCTDPISAASPAPAILMSWLAIFRPCFSGRVWNHILVLVAGAVLAPGKLAYLSPSRYGSWGWQLNLASGRYHEALNRARGAGICAMSRAELLRHLLAVTVA